MNDMNDDGPARDSNPQPLAYQANALPTELLGLATHPWEAPVFVTLISE